MTIVRFLTDEEHSAIEQRRYAARGNMRDYFLPGMAWYCPWYFDPKHPREIADADDLPITDPERCLNIRIERGLQGKSFLSVNYWRDWARTRPPITVVCPNGEQWCIDQKANNGPGWTVGGNFPDNGLPSNITAMPSIVVPGYHGWLGVQGALPGQFTGDIEGRGPNGKFVPYTERK
jgi:hypothetical protein